MPVKAKYIGGGQFGSKKPPTFADLRRNKRSDTDFRALNGVSDDDPEVQLARAVGFFQNNGQRSNAARNGNVSTLGSNVRQVLMATDDESVQRPIYPAGLLKILQTGREDAVNTSIVSQNSVPAEGFSELVTEAMTAGGYTILLKPDKGGHENEAMIPLDGFNGKEWFALFNDVLGCRLIEPFPSLQNENNPHAPGTKNELQLQQLLRDFPMLARISSLYDDVVYESAEVMQLRNECLALTPSASSNQLALSGLNKLIAACEEALRSGASIILASD